MLTRSCCVQLLLFLLLLMTVMMMIIVMTQKLIILSRIAISLLSLRGFWRNQSSLDFVRSASRNEAKMALTYLVRSLQIHHIRLHNGIWIYIFTPFSHLTFCLSLFIVLLFRFFFSLLFCFIILFKFCSSFLAFY